MKQRLVIFLGITFLLLNIHMNGVAQNQQLSSLSHRMKDSFDFNWQFPTEKNVINNHVFLRLKNINNTVNMYYSTDGKKWNKIENSLEVSAMHHNVLGGFMSVRIGLCSIGEGSVTFKNFTYKPIK